MALDEKKVREAVETAFAKNSVVYVRDGGKVTKADVVYGDVLNAITAAVLACEERPTVSRNGLWDAVDDGWDYSEPTRGEVTDKVVTYLKDNGVEVRDDE